MEVKTPGHLKDGKIDCGTERTKKGVRNILFGENPLLILGSMKNRVPVNVSTSLLRFGGSLPSEHTDDSR